MVGDIGGSIPGQPLVGPGTETPGYVGGDGTETPKDLLLQTQQAIADPTQDISEKAKDILDKMKNAIDQQSSSFKPEMTNVRKQVGPVVYDDNKTSLDKAHETSRIITDSMNTLSVDAQNHLRENVLPVVNQFADWFQQGTTPELDIKFVDMVSAAGLT